MVIRYGFGVLAVLAMLSGPAGAQTSPLVVPEGVAVAVPARGAPALPRTAAAAPQPRPRPARLAPSPAEPASAMPPAVALLPLVAAVALAATLSGGGGGGGISAPIRTR
ncbi:hypothetical protein [Roseicella aerolata]|uniref:Uncharacterized protein n=1 Tax=Roseicella aerolata TaxID=2883479 RepID=A0A9X1ICD5_9PROT|nr:hypothetical protein [Roseicella aerolata]MCB4822255.1 hypothetical protein [Roseicella aerolata]